MEPLVKSDGFDLDRCLAELDLHPEHVHDVPDDHIEKTAAAHEALAPMPFDASCLRDHTAVHHSGKRPLSAIIWLVIHDEEAPTALSAASWFENPRSAGSAHVCSDAKSCYRTLGDEYVAWGAPGANYHGLHFEQAGYASWTRAKWMGDGRKTIKRTAYKVAFHAVKYELPLRVLTVAQIRAGYKGVVTHLRLTQAFGGTHHDPGTHYPLDVLVADAKRWRAESAW